MITAWKNIVRRHVAIIQESHDEIQVRRSLDELAFIRKLVVNSPALMYDVCDAIVCAEDRLRAFAAAAEDDDGVFQICIYFSLWFICVLLMATFVFHTSFIMAH